MCYELFDVNNVNLKPKLGYHVKKSDLADKKILEEFEKKNQCAF